MWLSEFVHCQESKEYTGTFAMTLDNYVAN